MEERKVFVADVTVVLNDGTKTNPHMIRRRVPQCVMGSQYLGDELARKRILQTFMDAKTEKYKKALNEAQFIIHEDTLRELIGFNVTHPNYFFGNRLNFGI